MGTQPHSREAREGEQARGNWGGGNRYDAPFWQCGAFRGEIGQWTSPEEKDTRGSELQIRPSWRVWRGGGGTPNIAVAGWLLWAFGVSKRRFPGPGPPAVRGIQQRPHMGE